MGTAGCTGQSLYELVRLRWKEGGQGRAAGSTIWCVDFVPPSLSSFLAHTAHFVQLGR